MELCKLTPSLQNILDQNTLKWIIVGGEGGAGKPTCSAALAVLLSKVREKVLVLAINDFYDAREAFGESFTTKPSPVEGFDNLFVMELVPSDFHVDDNPEIKDKLIKVFPEFAAEIQELVAVFPGYFETISFAEVLKLYKSEEFSVIVFVASTIDYTMRFLSFPRLILNGIQKLIDVKPQFSRLVSQIADLLGLQSLSFTEDILPTLKKINEQFHDSNEATVICICNADKLSINETQLFIDKLTKSGIDTHNIVVNKVLLAENHEETCECYARIKLHEAYIDEISEVFKKFNVTKLPLLEKNVFGADKIVEISKILANSFVLK